MKLAAKRILRHISVERLLLAAVLVLQALIIWRLIGDRRENARPADAAGRSVSQASSRGRRVVSPLNPGAPPGAALPGDPTSELIRIQDEIDRIFRAAFGGHPAGMPFRVENGQLVLAPSPLDSTDTFRSRMIRMMEREFDGFAWFDAPPGALPGSKADLVISPALDMREYGDRYVVSISLPGIDRSGVSVELDGQMLAVSATDNGAGPASYRFEKRVLLPGPVDAGSAEARMTNGVLRVTVPKAPENSDKSPRML